MTPEDRKLMMQNQAQLDQTMATIAECISPDRLWLTVKVGQNLIENSPLPEEEKAVLSTFLNYCTAKTFMTQERDNDA